MNVLPLSTFNVQLNYVSHSTNEVVRKLTNQTVDKESSEKRLHADLSQLISHLSTCYQSLGVKSTADFHRITSSDTSDTSIEESVHRYHEALRNVDDIITQPISQGKF